jgi:hypothetical protein
MKPIDEYIRNLSKCNNRQCELSMTCLRYNAYTTQNLKTKPMCDMYFAVKIDDTLNQLKGMFGMQ